MKKSKKAASSASSSSAAPRQPAAPREAPAPPEPVAPAPKKAPAAPPPPTPRKAPARRAEPKPPAMPVVVEEEEDDARDAAEFDERFEDVELSDDSVDGGEVEDDEDGGNGEVVDGDEEGDEGDGEVVDAEEEEAVEKEKSVLDEIREAVQGKTVAIVAMGNSIRDFVEESTMLGSPQMVCDELWTINATSGLLPFDRSFMLDPPARFFDPNPNTVMGDSGSMGPGMAKFLSTYAGKAPIYTSTLDDRVPNGLVLFPLREFVEKMNSSYWNTTLAFAVGTAILAGVKTLKLYGCCFSYQAHPTHTAEAGRANVEYWLAKAEAQGIEVKIAKSSSLMDTNVPLAQKLYGFHRLPDPPIPVIEESGNYSVRSMSELREMMSKQEQK